MDLPTPIPHRRKRWLLIGMLALVVVNPPYLLEKNMREWLPELQALLAADGGGSEVLACSGGR